MKFTPIIIDLRWWCQYFAYISALYRYQEYRFYHHRTSDFHTGISHFTNWYFHISILSIVGPCFRVFATQIWSKSSLYLSIFDSKLFWTSASAILFSFWHFHERNTPFRDRIMLPLTRFSSILLCDNIDGIYQISEHWYRTEYRIEKEKRYRALAYVGWNISGLGNTTGHSFALRFCDKLQLLTE